MGIDLPSLALGLVGVLVILSYIRQWRDEQIRTKALEIAVEVNKNTALPENAQSFLDRAAQHEWYIRKGKGPNYAFKTRHLQRQQEPTTGDNFSKPL